MIGSCTKQLRAPVLGALNRRRLGMANRSGMKCRVGGSRAEIPGTPRRAATATAASSAVTSP
jgi:hypothetical protein